MKTDRKNCVISCHNNFNWPNMSERFLISRCVPCPIAIMPLCEMHDLHISNTATTGKHKQLR